MINNASIVAIFASENDEMLFLGTGLVVNASTVVTCRHVLLETDPFGRATDTLYDQFYIGNSELKAPVKMNRAVVDEQWDLAMLSSDSKFSLQPARFLQHITQSVLDQYVSDNLMISGYPAVDKGTALWNHAISISLMGYRGPEQYLAQAQITGGIPKGCSGGPVFLQNQDQSLCMGVVYLGGEKSTSSRMIAGDPVLEFLRQQGAQDIQATTLKSTRSGRPGAGAAPATGGALKNLSTPAVVRLIIFSFLLIGVGMALLLGLPDGAKTQNGKNGIHTKIADTKKTKIGTHTKIADTKKAKNRTHTKVSDTKPGKFTNPYLVKSSDWIYSGNNSDLGYGAYPDNRQTRVGSACVTKIHVPIASDHQVHGGRAFYVSGTGYKPRYVFLKNPDGSRQRVVRVPNVRGPKWVGRLLGFSGPLKVGGAWTLVLVYPGKQRPTNAQQGTNVCQRYQDVKVHFNWTAH
jgi:hypothetical protein